MFISDMANSGSRPVLEQMLRFAGERQRILAHNIANGDRMVPGDSEKFSCQLN